MLDLGSSYGFAVYLLEIFIPGIGIGELTRAWRQDWGLSERIGMAFGLGLAFDTLVLVVATSGMVFVGDQLRGSCC